MFHRGMLNSYGAFENYYTKNVLASSSSSDISWIGSLQGFLLLFVGAISGPLYDSGYFQAVTWAGSFFVVFGMMMTSLATSYYQILLAQGLTVGIGCGCLFIPAVALVGSYFTTRRNFAVGVVTIGASIAGIIYPIVFNRLQPVIGFGWTTRVIGFIALGTLGISHALMRTRHHPSAAMKAVPTHRRLIDKTAFESPAFLLFTFGLFLALLGLYVPMFYLPTYGRNIAHVSPTFTVYFVAIVNSSSVFGRVIPNYLADIFGPLTIIGPCVLSASIMAFCWLAIDAEPGMIVFCVIYGFFVGAIVSLPANCVFHLTADHRLAGTRLGMCFAIASLGMLTGNPIAGAILTGTGDNGADYRGIQYWTASLLASGAVLIVIARGVQSKWTLSSRC